MDTIESSAGTIEYADSGGSGPVLVLVHGLLMDSTLWDDTVARLPAGYRCLRPVLPLGAHRVPVTEDADLSLPGQARLVGEFLQRLGLHDVTLVGADTGGAVVQLVLTDGAPQVGRAVLVGCEAFDNVPAGLTGKTVVLAGRLSPRLFGIAVQQMRLRPLRRLPLSFGWLTRRGDAVTRRWLSSVLTRNDIRRDAVRALRAIGADTGVLERAVEPLRAFSRPVLVVWSREDRVMPPAHGRRLAELFPDGRLVEVDDSATLVPLDRPDVLADLISGFVPAGTAAG
ncbi:alpha/beta hydrolase [Geodermatophilus sp. TF02-6]|uniref:alpha/beta fold hydrolase n=1 Tax=Geodermatophilus sp. TF02-6 TaxID=2250575 RepID=UPI000DE825BA|nr:alpha/beta hydrolase [Geodermatophilus sp. TF02-6]RBY80925.1 alpha/beta hydrolase [Geodermatophilus sp. TF02-6]